MKSLFLVLLVAIVFSAAPATGQTSSGQPQVSNLLAVLTKAVETKTAKPGDEVILRSISDLSVDGQIVIARGSQLTGKIIEAIAKDKDNPDTFLAFSVEKAVLKNGNEIPLQAIVAALAAPRKGSLADDPTLGMLHSNEPKMVGGATSTSSSGNLGASSKSSSSAAVAAANLFGKLDQPTVLDADSQGAVDIEGLQITWRLLAPPPVTVISSKSKNLKLETGTQVLLRMATPRRQR
ncbi:MAG TPA: hypothetical protein VN643_14435 [Pyrinomonadaceae bacterium]|nr:hypothetical protein [Pyrinomonadaceae bacterium]